MNQFRKYDPLDPDNREAAESLQRLVRPSPSLETASSTVQLETEELQRSDE